MALVDFALAALAVLGCQRLIEIRRQSLPTQLPGQPASRLSGDGRGRWNRDLLIIATATVMLPLLIVTLAQAWGTRYPIAQGPMTRVSDRATFAYIGVVYVLPEYRGRGLSRWMMETFDAHPELQGLRRWMLMTKDAHALYTKFGFTPLARPDRAMERTHPGVYARPS